MSATADRSLKLMGTTVRIVVGPPARAGLPAAGQAAAAAEAFLRDYDRALSRFRPDSELSALNADARAVVPASPLLRDAVRAALQAASRSGGLVDPALHDALIANGYESSWDPARRLDMTAALAACTAPRAAAQAHPAARWREITVDDDAGTIARPPGLRLDTGGTGKGHAADLAGALLEGYSHWAVDCGGDVRIGGTAAVQRRVDVRSPFDGDAVCSFLVRDGAAATSGLSSRIWSDAGGSLRHHLLDPSTGRPAFTGLVAVTALAPTAVEAETLAKTALLQGPEGARALLACHGGAMFAESGELQRIEVPARGPVVRLRMPVRSAA